MLVYSNGELITQEFDFDILRFNMKKIETFELPDDYVSYIRYHYLTFNVETKKMVRAENWTLKFNYYVDEYWIYSISSPNINTNDESLDSPNDEYPVLNATSPFMTFVNTDYGSSYYLVCYSDEDLTQQVGNTESLNICSNNSYTFGGVSLTNVFWQ